MTSRDTDQMLQELGLKEYEATALSGLLELGRTTAPNLVEATDIPQARIYTVLEKLSELGFVEVFPTRPKEYQSKSPEEILKRAKENHRQDYEEYCRHIDNLSDDFLNTFEPIFDQASEVVHPTEELFHVVDIGEPSLQETRELYANAEQELTVVTKSFEYFSEVKQTFEDTLDRGVQIRVLFLDPQHLTDDNQMIQEEIVREVNSYEGVQVQFSNERLPLRGSIADPSLEYDSGTAILLVENPDVPLHMRQAAITENPAFVAGIHRYTNLIWEYDSSSKYRL